MIEEIRLVEQPKKVLSMHPKKFALWLFMVSIVMIFASLTSAFIVKKSGGEWLLFELPSIFQISTFILLLSSASMQWAYFAAKNNQINKLKTALITTSLLGVLFLYTQLNGWSQLVAANVYFVGNPAGSFVYVLTGVHAFHLITGLVFIAIVTYSLLDIMFIPRKWYRLKCVLLTGIFWGDFGYICLYF